MKKIKLSDKDYRDIKSYALDIWKEKAPKDDFLCRCYIDAFLRFLNSRNLKVIDGKIYEQESN